MIDKVHREIKDYEDILHLPHYESSRRPKMPIKDRAAQFAPFSAVVGHDNAVKEAARVTTRRRELDEMEKAIIDEQLREIEGELLMRAPVEITYFQPDLLKAGGQYVTKTGKVKKIDAYEKEILMEDNMRIAIDEIYRIGL